MARYGGHVHFVLELVQNADDNTFEAGATPTLRIRAEASRIEFFNNEVGFTERNVLALCSMGESTKKASDAGYIGNKVRPDTSLFSLARTRLLAPPASFRAWISVRNCHA